MTFYKVTMTWDGMDGIVDNIIQQTKNRWTVYARLLPWFRVYHRRKASYRNTTVDLGKELVCAISLPCLLYLGSERGHNYHWFAAIKRQLLRYLFRVHKQTPAASTWSAWVCFSGCPGVHHTWGGLGQRPSLPEVLLAALTMGSPTIWCRWHPAHSWRWSWLVPFSPISAAGHIDDGISHHFLALHCHQVRPQGNLTLSNPAS
jgi:hypothetical protein